MSLTDDQRDEALKVAPRLLRQEFEAMKRGRHLRRRGRSVRVGV